MKKILILIVVIFLNYSGFAQRSFTKNPIPVTNINPYHTHINSSARTTAIGDTDVLSNIPDTVGLVLYPLGIKDSGYVIGTNFWGDKAFAEQYTFNGADSSMSIIGVFAQFGGTVSTASAQTVNFTLWSQGPRQMIGANLYYNGFPDLVADSVIVPVTSLGIGAAADTMKMHLFAAPSHVFSGPFFVGYSMNYNFMALTGDTIGLASSKNGVREGAASSLDAVFYYNDTFIYNNEIVVSDTEINTILNVQNATMEADSMWHDNYTDNDSLYNNLAIYPIVMIQAPTAVKGINRNNFTFYGNYPNPATDNTNIRFSLATNTNVTIQIMDMSGRVVNTIHEPNLYAGENIIPVNTSGMPAGDYIYLIRTTDGSGIASKMTVNH